MILNYILILIAFTNSYKYNINILEPYSYVYYANDILKTEDNIIIYQFQPQSKEREIFISFLGHSDSGSFEFYLYSNLADINYTDNKTFTNYLEKIDYYNEIKINHDLDQYYILVKMNSNKDIYKYLCFMIYNIKESLDIGKYKKNNDYILAFKGYKDITLNYPAKNISRYFYLKMKGDCYNINYEIYKNNESINNITLKQQYQSLNFSFIENNSYYIKIRINSYLTHIIRFVLYFLDNMKDIVEIKDSLTDIKYGYSDSGVSTKTIKYYFINIENVPINDFISYHIFEPFNKLFYKIYIKYYENYDINELPIGSEIKDFDYEDRDIYNIKYEPMIYFLKKKDAKGLLFRIDSYMYEETDEFSLNEMIMYLSAKKLFEITENIKFNYTQLLTKNAFFLSYKYEQYLLIKSNLNYFNMLAPSTEKIQSKSYIINPFINYESYFFEFDISENASVKLRFIDRSNISVFKNPNIMHFCKNNISEEKYIYLPYMTNFNILYGDIEIYDMNISKLNNLDDFFNENYLDIYNFHKRYDDYSSLKEEQFFYKLKCNKYSLIKLEDAFDSITDENIIIKPDTKKLILDFSENKQKKIIFESNLPIYIGILNSSELNKDWILNFSINNENYSLNYENNIFFKEVTNNDILKIEKPDNNIHVYIKTIYNYNIETFRPMNISYSGIFVFDKNITEEYETLIDIYNKDSIPIPGEYSLFYGNPKDYEYNQLFDGKLDISNNPYKYLKEDDKNKTFFIIYQKYSDNGGLNIIKLSERNLILNNLILLETSDYEDMKLKLPKFNNEKVIAFIQYIAIEIDVFNKDKKLEPYKYGEDYKIYIFENSMEPYANSKIILSHKSFFYVSYINYNTVDDIYNQQDCKFSISDISDSSSSIKIIFETFCTSSYNYYVFIDYNSDENKENNPMKLYYEKDKNRNIKYYECKDIGNKELEIKDSFEEGEMNIAIVGQDIKGFNKFVYSSTKHIFKKSKIFLVIIIVVSVVLVAILIVLILYFCKIKRRKNNFDDIFGDEKTKVLTNKKAETKCLDFIDYDDENDDKKEM